MEKIYAILYTSDPYEPSSLRGLFRTKEEYARICYDREIAELEELVADERFNNYQHQDETKLRLPFLKNLNATQIVEEYPIDIENQTDFDEKEVIEIEIGKFGHWS